MNPALKSLGFGFLFAVAMANSAHASKIQDRADKPANPAEICQISESDQAWIARAIDAWHYTSSTITMIGPVDQLQTVFFDEDCVLISDDAMAGVDRKTFIWSRSNHSGSVTLPDGRKIQAGVQSSMITKDDGAFMVMSLPSIWKSGGVNGGALGLETLMVAVLLHEGTHIVQFPTYGETVTKLIEDHNLADSFNDDSIQQQFEGNFEFSASVQNETELLFVAAAAVDDTKAKNIAGQALTLLRDRRAKWFTGDHSYLSDAEDLWLTLEGSGQWAGYSWLTDPKGAGLSQETAMAGFGKRSKWWTQKQGLAMFLAIDRLGYDWKSHAFGNADLTVTEMLAGALSE